MKATKAIKTTRTAAFIIGFIYALICAVGCGRIPTMDPAVTDSAGLEEEDAKYVKVTTDYSPYSKRVVDWKTRQGPLFYLDPQKEVPAEITEVSFYTNKVRIPSDIYDLYVEPPRILLTEEVEEQTISLDQAFPIETEYFTITSADIPQLLGEAGRTYPQAWMGGVIIRVTLTSETERYPGLLSLRWEDKVYSPRGISSEALEERDTYVQFQSYYWEVPDLYTASMVIKNGTVSYTELQKVIKAEEASYICDDPAVTVHVLE